MNPSHPYVRESRRDRTRKVPLYSGQRIKPIAKMKHGLLLTRNSSCPCGSGKRFKRCHALDGRWLEANCIPAKEWIG